MLVTTRQWEPQAAVVIHLTVTRLGVREHSLTSHCCHFKQLLKTLKSHSSPHAPHAWVTVNNDLSWLVKLTDKLLPITPTQHLGQFHPVAMTSHSQVEQISPSPRTNQVTSLNPPSENTTVHTGDQQLCSVIRSMPR